MGRAGERAERLLKAAGVAACALYCGWVVLIDRIPPAATTTGRPYPAGGGFTEIRLLALGDINLGRRVGQRILAGDTLYPFANVADTLHAYDVVFANLESNISEQHGRTEDPRNNMIFTAPPAAAQSLRRAGVRVVATANNHALDFGVSARDQTLRYLDSAGIAHCGTSEDPGRLYAPAYVTAHGIRLAFFAVTDIMNGPGPWTRLVASADTSELLPSLRAARDSADIVIVSFHGGVEYAPEASGRTRAFARQALEGGADLVLGHHPHIPYGIAMEIGKPAVHSLGNFVFMQPDRYWTRYSYGLSVDIVRDATGARIRAMQVLPLRAGFQPAFLAAGSDAEAVQQRLRLLSSQDVREHLIW